MAQKTKENVREETKENVREETVREPDVAEGKPLTSLDEVVTDPAPIDPSPVEVSQTGVRARRAFMMKQFIPSQDWIMKNVVAAGKGTRATVGRVFGVCFGTAPKKNILPDGSTVDSIVITGLFQAECYATGEISECSTAYLPMAYAEKIAAMFKMDESIKVVEIDCDIGLEATGKTIPYEWVVIAFREGEEMATMKKIRGSRNRPTQFLLTADGIPK